MFVLLSPAKTLDFTNASSIELATQPRFLEQSAELMDILKGYAPDEISSLMNISMDLAHLNAERFHHWRLPMPEAETKQALFAFKGDVYVGLDADTLTAKQCEFAQQHVRILSGLYGLLRPLDKILPYRLEMGTKLANAKGKDLYQFWGDSLTQALNQELAAQGSELVINLASNEYFKAIQPKKLQAQLVTPVFKDEKNGQFKIVSFYAKKARGLMTRWLIEQNRVIESKDAIQQLQDFNVAGYRFDAEESTATTLVFKRKEQDIVHA